MGFNSAFKGLNPICHLLALLGARPILHISRIRANEHDIMDGSDVKRVLVR